jgi:hypothetical protein
MNMFKLSVVKREGNMIRSRKNIGQLAKFISLLVVGVGLLFSLSGKSTSALQVGRVKSQGIQGQLTVSPTTTQCLSVAACSAPYQTSMVVLAQAGHKPKTLNSDTNGMFKLGLAPGSYVVNPVPGHDCNTFPHRYPCAVSQTVLVTAGRYTSLSISFDSGIR